MAKKTNFTVNGIDYYRVTATIGFDSSGKRIRKQFLGKSKKEALAERDKYLAGIESGLEAGYEKITLGDFFSEWLTVVHKPTLAISTFRRYDSLFNNWITNSNFYNKRIVDLKSMDIQKHINKIPSPDTAVRIYNLMSTFFKYCLLEGIVIRNPLLTVTLPKVNKKKKSSLSPDNITKLSNAYNKDNDLFIYFFDMLTGLRIGELCALTVADVDLDRLTINIDKTLNRISVADSDGAYKNKMFITPPKTTKSVREIPILKELIAPIKKHILLEKTKHLKCGVNYSGSSPFFTSTVCSYLRADRLNNKWKKIQPTLGIEPVITFHELRHTFATICARTGVPLTTAAELLGHDRIDTTAETYTHIDREMKKQAIQKVSSIL